MYLTKLVFCTVPSASCQCFCPEVGSVESDQGEEVHGLPQSHSLAMREKECSGHSPQSRNPSVLGIQQVLSKRLLDCLPRRHAGKPIGYQFHN